MRKPRAYKTEIENAYKPVPMMELKDDDCFGKEWDMTTTDCKSCGDNTMCGLQFAKQTLPKKVKEQEKTDGKYLDTTDLAYLDVEEYVMWLSLVPRNVDAFYDKIAKDANTDYEEGIIAFMKRVIAAGDFKVNKSTDLIEPK
jgi:hypothetical protein